MNNKRPNSDNIIECVSYKIYQVGKTIKSTKERHEWIFRYNNNAHYLKLFVSKLTLKKALLLDDRIMIQKQKMKKPLSASFQIKNDKFILKEVNDKYELLINGIVFSNLINTLPCASPFNTNHTPPCVIVLKTSGDQQRSLHNKRYSEISHDEVIEQ